MASQVRTEVLEAMKISDLRVSTHAERTGRAVSAINYAVRALMNEGVVTKVGRGTYRLATESDMVKPNGNGGDASVVKNFKKSIARDAKLERALTELCPKGIVSAKLGTLLQWLELSKELAE